MKLGLGGESRSVDTSLILQATIVTSNIEGLKNSTMTFNATLLLCPFTTVLDIFMLRVDTAKQHYNNVGLNVLDNASLVVYQATLAEHWLVMGFKTDNSPVDAWLFKMETTIKNIASFAAVGNLTINQLMERKAVVILTANVAYVKESKWTIVMAKNMC